MSTKRVRVLYVAPEHYAPNRRNYNQLQRVLYAPGDVDVTVLVAKGAPVPADTPGSVAVHGARLPGRLGFCAAELRLLLNHRFDAIVTTNTFEAIPAWLMRGVGGYRWVADIWDTPQKALVTYHAIARGPKARMRRWAARLKVALFQKALRRADLVIVSACAEGMHGYRIPRARLRVFSNAIALAELERTEEARIPDSICYVSSVFLPDRGLDTLAEAVQRVDLPDGRAPLVRTAGVLPPAVEDDLRRRDRGRRIELLGPVSLAQAHNVMRQAEIGVLPFHDNEDLAHTQPVKLFEYMALGCVVVASDLPGFREIVRDGIDGLLVPAGDAAALAEALKLVLCEDDLRSRLRDAAQERVKRFDALAKVKSVYAEIESVCT